MTKSGRPTGLETTVSAVRFSISRVSTLVAMNAASSAPLRKIVASPRSISMRWSSSIVNPESGAQMITATLYATSTTSRIGWRMLSKNVLAAMARSCPSMEMGHGGRPARRRVQDTAKPPRTGAARAGMPRLRAGRTTKRSTGCKKSDRPAEPVDRSGTYWSRLKFGHRTRLPRTTRRQPGSPAADATGDHSPCPAP
jgi:hypothetical protein